MRKVRVLLYTRAMIRKAFTAALAGTALIATAGAASAAIPASGIPAFETRHISAHPERPSAASGDGWHQVGDGITSGISGIVVDGRHEGAVRALAVRDNKKPGENRLVALEYRAGAAPQVRTVSWSGQEAVDLEAIDAVPGQDSEYVALASDGTAYRIHREKDTASVRETFRLPGISDEGNYEGFSLSVINGNTVAVWADRGQDDRPGTLSAAVWNPKTGEFGAPVSAEFRVPYPATNVRHVSDVKISADGGLTVSSASDPGDDGPYDSALYDAGRVSVDGAHRVHLDVADSPDRLGVFRGHKIEALACVPGTHQGLLGTDDENAGGAVTSAAFCRP